MWRNTCFTTDFLLQCVQSTGNTTVSRAKYGISFNSNNAKGFLGSVPGVKEQMFQALFGFYMYVGAFCAVDYLMPIKLSTNYFCNQCRALPFSSTLKYDNYLHHEYIEQFYLSQYFAEM